MFKNGYLAIFAANIQFVTRNLLIRDSFIHKHTFLPDYEALKITKVRYLLNVILILIIYTTAKGQTKSLQFTPIDKNYNRETASEAQLDSFYYNLEPIETSDKKIHIRISLSDQKIDLYSITKDIYEGIVTNFTTEYRNEKVEYGDGERTVAKQKVYEKVNLDADIVKSVIDSLLFSGQFEIPTDTLIPNWDNWTWHCSSIYFQHKINGQYQSQRYRYLWAQEDSVSYKNVIVGNYDLIRETFSLDSLYNKFASKLSTGIPYSKDDYMMILVKMTDEEIKERARDKPRRDYLKSVRDTIDSYINTELKKQNIELEEIKCFKDYQLIFGTDGKLAEIILSKRDKPRLKNSIGLGGLFANIREVRKCKSKIREIFQEIDLSGLNARCEIYRSFSFDYKGEFHLRDNTIY